MKRLNFKPFLLGFGLVLSACASSPPPSKMLSADLKGRSGTTTIGHVHFHQLDKKLHVAYEVKNLKAGGKHGFRLHTKGDCSAADAKSAGEPSRDLGPIVSNEKGISKGELYLENTTLSQLIGLSVIVHEKEIEGNRIACGVLQ